MMEVLHKKLQQYKTYEEKYNALREFLQTLILKILDEQGYFRHLAFVGGTALRILYDLQRFSEDLDFCLINSTNYSFGHLMRELERQLSLENLDVSIRFKEQKAVASAFIKFESVHIKIHIYFS